MKSTDRVRKASGADTNRETNEENHDNNIWGHWKTSVAAGSPHKIHKACTESRRPGGTGDSIYRIQHNVDIVLCRFSVRLYKRTLEMCDLVVQQKRPQLDLKDVEPWIVRNLKRKSSNTRTIQPCGSSERECWYGLAA